MTEINCGFITRIRNGRIEIFVLSESDEEERESLRFINAALPIWEKILRKDEKSNERKEFHKTYL